MSIGNIIKATFAGVGIGGLIGAAFIEDGIGQFASETFEDLGQVVEQLSEAYSNEPNGASSLTSVLIKIQKEAPEFAADIRDALPNAREATDLDAFVKDLPDIPDIPDDIRANVLEPKDIESYEHFKDNYKTIMGAWADAARTSSDVLSDMSDNIGKGALVGGGLFASGAALKDVPSWTEKVAHSVDTRVHGKG